ncbi:MAG TPA: hypothetical protein VE686_07070 [Beijerinckiaceae bacterium]|nr:hypothetical protein [Beijerinckiaceae bacterium]
MSLTGRFNFRRTWTGKIVLQVEDERRSMFGKGFRKRWRDANVLDLAAPSLRRLIDLRLKPQYGAEAPAAAAPAAVDGMAAPIEVMPTVPARTEGQPSGRIVTH